MAFERILAGRRAPSDAWPGLPRCLEFFVPGRTAAVGGTDDDDDGDGDDGGGDIFY